MELTTPTQLAAILAAAAAAAAGDSAVIATNVAGTIVYWNDRAESLYGWRADEAVGRPILDVTPTRGTLDEATRIMEQFERGATWSGPFIVQRRDGTPIVIEFQGHPVRANDAVVGIVGISRRRPPDGSPS